MSDYGDETRRRTTASHVPPHNLLAEESLLGAMLLSRDAIGAALESCSTDDFYKPAYAHVFDAITRLYGVNEPVDPVTVAEDLRRNDLLDAIGGPAVLTDLQGNTPAIGSASKYALIVAELALLRRLIGVSSEIAEIAYSLPEDVPGAVDEAERMVFALAERRQVDSVVGLRDMTDAGLDRLTDLFDRGDAMTGLATGYYDLDQRLSGLQPSAFYVVGARPAMGKTSFGTGLAIHAAVEVGVPVLFFSLEMSRSEVTERVFASEAKIELTKLRTGRLLDQDWSKLSGAIGRFVDAPFFVDDNTSTTIMDMRARARRMKSREGLGLVVVDYIQLMPARHNAENRQVAVSEISRGLKVLARELEVPVVALAQLSRNLEQRADKRPMLADLRESGSLEQDADVVMFLYRDEMYYPESPDRGVAEVIVAKHRSGPTGTDRLAFLDRYSKFANMARI